MVLGFIFFKLSKRRKEIPGAPPTHTFLYAACDFLVHRTRRLLKQSRKEAENVGVTKVVNMIQSREQGEAEMEPEAKWVGFGGGGGDTIILDTTAEFCKQVGEEDKGQKVHVCMYLYIKQEMLS